ncbi:hypothetical protein C3B78_04315 [Arthrobacter sp. PGP41]|uniref:hypothetical protein n=1 Tax=Arthrobacter sp. PGP41 TaxID=2079227 RepID=UPI000CDC8C69|nr:hypothetical protein [Arthrobacter sp. PGP41]AUZ33760.1 hypothetical protein C3B78_04315 [Arthrobacter sp. PGP41]
MSSEHKATGADSTQHGHRLEDERCVDALLAEAGYTDDPGLRDVLLKLRELRVADVPPPSAELAALMGGPGEATVNVLEPGKQPKKRRIAFTTLAVAASLGIASGAAAASEEIRRSAEGTIMNIVRAFSAPLPTAPAPALPSREPGSAPAVAGDPAEDRTVPYPPGPRPAEHPASDSGQEPAAEKPPTPGHAPGAAKASPDGAAGAAAGVPADANRGAETPGPGPTGAPPVPAPAPVNSTEPANERGISRAHPDGKDSPLPAIEPQDKQGTRR